MFKQRPSQQTKHFSNISFLDFLRNKTKRPIPTQPSIPLSHSLTSPLTTPRINVLIRLPLISPQALKGLPSRSPQSRTLPDPGAVHPDHALCRKRLACGLLVEQWEQVLQPSEENKACGDFKAKYSWLASSIRRVASQHMVPVNCACHWLLLK